jgi:hypothetical protein
MRIWSAYLPSRGLVACSSAVIVIMMPARVPQLVNVLRDGPRARISTESRLSPFARSPRWMSVFAMNEDERERIKCDRTRQ